MKAISVKCPNCAASLDVAGTAMTVACEFCHTTSKISRRTMFLERRMLAPGPTMQGMPVAVERHSTTWFVGLALVPLILAAGIAGAIAFKKGMLGRGGQLLWHQIGPIQTTDANGDGVEDPIGFAMHPFSSNNYTTLIAVSGTTGDVLWESDSLGEFDNNIASAKIVTTDAAIFLALDAGQLLGFDPSTGAATWRAQLAEKPKRFCGTRDDASLAIETADGAWSKLVTVDGSLSAQEPELDCLAIGGNYMGTPSAGTRELVQFGHIAESLNMFVDRVFQRNGSDAAVAFGARGTGTRVPMVGVYRQSDHQAIWTAEAPASNPLAAETGAPEGQISDEHVVLMYEVDNSPRITVFRLADGKRLWDVAVPQRWRVVGLGIVGDSVLVSSTGLYSFDLATGALKYSTAATPNAHP